VTELFASGRIVDLILVMVAIEAFVLLTYRLRTGLGVSAARLLTNLLAGVFLLLALRSALIGSYWVWTSAWLGAGLFAHIADLAQRWRN
jgi:hypothetical protein